MILSLSPENLEWIQKKHRLPKDQVNQHATLNSQTSEDGRKEYWWLGKKSTFDFHLLSPHKQ